MNFEKVTTEDIANYLNKKPNTISGWNSKYPELSELVKIGAFCKKNNLDIEKIKKFAELQELIKDKS